MWRVTAGLGFTLPPPFIMTPPSPNPFDHVAAHLAIPPGEAAHFLPLVVAALARQIGGAGPRLGSMTGWLAFWAALSWQGWRAYTARSRRGSG